MNIKFLVLPAGALVAASLLLAPEEAVGFSTIGGSLSQSQRDFRVYNNFTDGSANNNTTADANWPGYFGADMAIWKACVEWASVAHAGTGAGDPTQTAVGGSDANFDPSWQGNATGVGNSNDNIHSELSGSSGGVLAFTETPISDGWRIRYYSVWSWHDGPGSVSGTDLQGVACHEYGHALGLGHTTTGGSTMFASISGTGQAQRSIESDDEAGVQFIYGVVDTNVKPRITSVNLVGTTLSIIGSNFANSGNEVWFTQASAGGNGTPIKVTGLISTSSNSIITTGLPANAGPGDILVKKGGNSGHSGLSNSWPFDPGQLPNPPANEVNIDLGVAQGAPGTGQGGAPGNVGAWNSVALPTATTGLFDLSQFQTTGTIGHTGSAGEFVFDEPASTGFYEKLFDDGHDIGCSPGSTVTYSFDGFSPGTYDVYVYSWALENPVNSLTNITVLTGQKGTQACGGVPYQNNLIDGGNYVFDQVMIGTGGTIQVTAAWNTGCARVNGFQILPGIPCGVASNYCTSGTSASGCQAIMNSSGSPSASAPSGFIVMADGVEGAKDGLFFFGDNGAQGNSWGNGTSFQCVVPPVVRAGLLPASGTVGACDGSFVQDFAALWTAIPSKNPGAGANVNVQLWYRDPQNTSNQTTSLSDGLNFVLCP